MQFVKATKSQSKGRMALMGISGSGKTWTALLFARALAGPNGRIGVIDTEAGSASKYSDEFSFDKLELDSFSPRSYIKAIHAAEDEGFDVIIVDSLSHAWCGHDGVLAMVDNATMRSGNKNSFTSGWREATPEHHSLVDTLVRCRAHLIVTMRSKTEYVLEEVNGKKIPVRKGMAPVQRDGLEYEFDVVGDMDTEHNLIITKSRCKVLADQVFRRPDAKPAELFKAWLTAGTAPVQQVTQSPQAEYQHEPPPLPKNGNGNGNGNNGNGVDYANDYAFGTKLANTFNEKGFDDAAVRLCCEAVCRNNSVNDVFQMGVNARKGLLAALTSGSLDRFKGQGQANGRMAAV
jgi:hypothetical protein